MRSIDLSTAHVTWVQPAGQPVDVTATECVAMTRDTFDALVLRVLLLEADPSDEAMQLVAALAA